MNISSVAGRATRVGSAVYNLTKHGVGAFSDSLRQEAVGPPRAGLARRAGRGVDRAGHHVARDPRAAAGAPGDVERLEAADIADAIAYIVTRPRHVAVNELLVRPTEQEN